MALQDNIQEKITLDNALGHSPKCTQRIGKIEKTRCGLEAIHRVKILRIQMIPWAD